MNACPFYNNTRSVGSLARKPIYHTGFVTDVIYNRLVIEHFSVLIVLLLSIRCDNS